MMMTTMTMMVLCQKAGSLAFTPPGMRGVRRFPVAFLTDVVYIATLKLTVGHQLIDQQSGRTVSLFVLCVSVNGRIGSVCSEQRLVLEVRVRDKRRAGLSATNGHRWRYQCGMWL